MEAVKPLRRAQELSFKERLETFLLAAASRNLARATLDWYKYCLRGFEHYVEKIGKVENLRDVTQRDIQEFLQERLQYQKEKGRTDFTVRRIYEALKIFFTYLHRENIVFINPVANIPAPRTSKRMLKPLTAEEVTALLESPRKRTFSGFRDYVLLMLFLDTGLRLDETLTLRLCDVNLQEGTLLVMGKGRKERKVPFGQTLKGLLARYLQMRGTLAGQELVFVNQYGQRLSPRRLQQYLKHYTRKAGIQKPVHPHLLRHTFALNFILQGGNPFILQEILGHTTLEMTRRYVSLANQSFTTNRVSFMDKLAESGQASLPRRKVF